MTQLRIREMTMAEFVAFRRTVISEYAAEHVRTGEWTEDRAEKLAAEETDKLLPDGPSTPGMLFLAGVTETDELVGTLWVALEVEGRDGAWIYAIDVVPGHRGRGYGRALLAAAEDDVRGRAIASIGLNVFGDNAVARSLYESAGYEISALHMRKRLLP